MTETQLFVVRIREVNVAFHGRPFEQSLVQIENSVNAGPSQLVQVDIFVGNRQLEEGVEQVEYLRLFARLVDDVEQIHAENAVNDSGFPVFGLVEDLLVYKGQ